MAVRTSPSKVLDVIDTSLTGPQIDAMIRAANLMVTAGPAAHDPAPGADVLAEIETWVAAHLVAVRDPRVAETRLDGESVKVQAAQLGKALESTIYGQQALLLDTTGALARMSVSRRAYLTAASLE